MLGRVSVRRVGAGAALLLAASAVMAFAVTSDGQPTRKVDLNDSGVWVTSNQDGVFGRVNKSVGAVDAVFNPPGGAQAAYGLDVLQDQSSVLARDVQGGRLYPVSTADGRLLADQAVDLAPGMQVDMRGGTIAALDPVTGQVWAARYDPAATVTGLAVLAPPTRPLASVGASPKGEPGGQPYAALAVGVDGGVHVVSRNGRMATIPVGADGELGKAITSSISADLGSVAVSAVGPVPVVLDAVGGAVLVGDHSTPLPEKDVTSHLQTPVASGPIAVATSRRLLSVPTGPEQGGLETLSDVGTGAPAAPVAVRGCLVAAWSGTPGAVVSSCGRQPARLLPLDRSKALVAPAFRVNRGQVVLNDMSDGRVFDLDLLRSIDTWKELEKPQANSSQQRRQRVTAVDEKKNKPIAKPDVLGARPGTTILHVLDNDSDPQGRVLSIQSVGEVSNSHASAAISPDGQTIRYTLDSSGDASFTYVISNGLATAQALVTVNGKGNVEETPPHRRATAPPSLTAASGATIPVQVLADWRDDEGDPVILTGASAPMGSVVTTPDGRVEYTAPTTEGGDVKVTYTVSDGRSSDVTSSFLVKVLSSDATRSTPATASPDVARGVVGRPVAVSPLENDTPGSDPIDPRATLRLAGPVAQKADVSVATDLDSGQVVVTPRKVGTFFLDYSAAFGTAALAKGTIRIDAQPDDHRDLPVAMPDYASVRGQGAVVIDVLANDTDPAGRLLTVQSADPVDPAQVQVAVIRGRWLRIQPTTASFTPSTQTVRYRVTNGSTSVTGEAMVTQLPHLASDTPVARPDYAVVRDGDSVLIRALDNDTTPSGAPVHLLGDEGAPAPKPGQLLVTDPGAKEGVTADVGTAYVAGDAIRFVAPGHVSETKTVVITYLVVNDAMERATGSATVTINPQPAKGREDQAPTPKPLEARVVAGDSANIPVSPSGTDPDGDSTSVIGIASAPVLGRVTGFSPTGITYQAYPTSAGTDSFSYVVTDRYGQQASSIVRIAVAPPGIPQLPVPVDDTLVAAPGARVVVAPLTNSLYAKSDPVRVRSLASTNASVPSGASLDAATNVVTVTAPPQSARPVDVQFGLAGSGGNSINGTISVRGQDHYNNPPRVFDQVASLSPGSTVTVDLLKNAYDPDGDSSRLRVSSVGASGTSISGGKATVPVLDRPQSIPFEVTDEGGAMSAAVAYVPARGIGGPYVKAGSLIHVAQGGSLTVPLKDYVLDPRGRAVTLTTQGRQWASPVDGVAVTPTGNGSLKVSAVGSYVGPGAVVVEVSDGSLDDPSAIRTVVSIPVQVGPDTPVLRCPTDVYTVYAGGATRTLDIPSVCSVWAPTPDLFNGLRFEATWGKAVAGVTVGNSGPRGITLEAAGSSRPNAAGSLLIRASGTKAVPATLNIQVLPAAKPRLAAISLPEMKQADSRTIDLRSYVTSPLKDAVPTVVSVRHAGGAPAAVTWSGSSITITPGAQTHGLVTFVLTASDVSDGARTDRQVTGTISFQVFGVPAQPSAPQPGSSVISRAAVLSWAPPAANGAPITSYAVQWSGGAQQCSASPCTINGLNNGTPYTFRVQATNKAGSGPWSAPSAAYTPDEAPKSVPGFRQTGSANRSVVLAWQPAVNSGSPLSRYVISGGGATVTVSGNATSATVPLVDNTNVHSFSIIAQNSFGKSAPASTTAYGQGVPVVSGLHTLPVDPVDSNTTAVTVAWDIAPEVPGTVPVVYTVRRTGGGATKTLVSGGVVSGSQLQDTGVVFGQTYAYTVTAFTTVFARTQSSATRSVTVTPVGKPAAWAPISATATGVDQQAKVDFSVPASRGTSSTVTLLVNGAVFTSFGTSPTAGDPGQSRTVQLGANGVAYSLALRDCNETGMCVTSNSVTVVPYGPIPAPGITVSKDGPTTFQVHLDANGNGRQISLHVWTDSGHAWDVSTTGANHWDLGQYAVSYSQTDTAHVTMSDTASRGVPGQVDSNTVTADPQPPSLVAYKGAPYTVAGCNTSACHYVNTRTSNFTGTVTCRITADSISDLGGFVSWTQGPNQDHQGPNVYGYSPGWVDVTCNGVTSRAAW